MVKSPCINICTIDKDSGLCIGCHRNEYEVFNWIYFSDEEKKVILSKIKEKNKINYKNHKKSVWEK